MDVMVAAEIDEDDEGEHSVILPADLSLYIHLQLYIYI